MTEMGEDVLTKTPEQLRSDLRFVNLEELNKYNSPFEAPQTAIDNPKDFIKEIRELRQNPSALQNSPYARYEEYVKALRQLRKSQKWDETKYEGQTNTEATASGREKYLESVRFAPDLARMVLIEQFNRVPFGSNDKPIFTDQEVMRGQQSEQDFLAVLNTGLDRQPAAVYKAPLYLMQILPPERVKELIESAGVQGVGFIYNYYNIKSLFTPKEQRVHIDAELSSKHNPYQVLSLFQNPDACELYTPQEVRTIVMDNFGLGDMAVDPNKAKYYLKNGVISINDLKQIVIGQVGKGADILRLPEVFPLLPDPHDIAEIKAAILDTYTTKAASKNAGGLYSVSEMFAPDEMSQMVRSIAFRDRSVTTLHRTEDFEDLITPEGYAPILKEVLATPDLQLDGVAVESVLNAQGLTDDEKERFIEMLISTNRAGLILDRDGQGFSGFRDEAVRDRVAKKTLLSCGTREAAEHYQTGWGGWKDKVGAQATLEIVDSATFSEAYAWIEQLPHLAGRVESADPDYLKRFLEKHKDVSAASLLFALPAVVKLLPEERRTAFTQELIKADPAMAIVMSAIAIGQEEKQGVYMKVGETPITPEQIIQMAQSDTDRLSFAPKALHEFIEKYQFQTPPETQKTLLLETMSIYRAIGFIKALGLEDSFKQVQSQKELSLPAEKDLVSTFHCFALLKDRDPEAFLHLESLGNSIDESKMVLFEQLAQLTGIDRQLNQEEIATFFGTMETPIPFMMYLLQYEESPTHKELLKNIFESVVTGRFSDWKFGPETQEGLDVLKQANLLPESLTLEQYSAWRNDGKTTLFESLATDTKTTANAISIYMQGNLHHLHIEETMELLLNKFPDQDLLVSVLNEIGAVGQDLAATNKELSHLRKSEATNTERIAELDEEKLKLENSRRELLRYRKILRIVGIRPDEVASGFFLEGKEGKQRGDSIVKVIGELRESAAEEDRFVYDEAQNMLASLQTTSDEKQNLLCTDSSDPKVWIEIGEKPVTSCQSYDNGGYNECLIAYTDPNTKILVLKNEKGSIIARSIFRLLTTSNGNPALHIERVYSSSTSKGVLRSIFERAHQKAQEMGVPLYMSEQSQDEDGEENQFEIAEGYQATKVDFDLVSKASRAQQVYVDSAGGLTYGGNYKINNLLEVQKAS